MTAEDDIQFLTGSQHRAVILDELCGAALRPTDLCDRVDATRTTVQRILAGFRDRKWVEKRDGDYRATVTGRRINEQYQAFRRAVERAEEFAPVATHLGEFGDDLPPAAFENGTVTAASDQEPLAAVDRVVEWLEESRGDHLRTATPIVARSFNETAAQLLEEGLTIDMVIDHGVLERSVRAFESALERGRTDDQVSVSVYPEPLPVGLMCRADRGGVVVYDETNNVRAVLEASDETVVEWVDEQFERIKADARPLETVLRESSDEY